MLTPTGSAVRLVKPDGRPQRPWFYLITAKGDPTALVHNSEARNFDHLPGKKLTYNDVEATNPRYPVAEPQPQQPFWILAPTERDVHDERGEAIFRIGPSAWALVIEDRGGAYVIRHDDGRIGYLHDISDITKG